MRYFQVPMEDRRLVEPRRPADTEEYEYHGNLPPREVSNGNDLLFAKAR